MLTKQNFQFFIKLEEEMNTFNQVILLNENLSWKKHLKLRENKNPKNIGQNIYKAKSI